MLMMIDAEEQPLIWIGRADYARLLRVSDRLSVHAPEVSAFLAKELDRAIVRNEDDIPRDVVRMGRRFQFRRTEDAAVEWGELAYPEQPATDGRISVASPLGAALLGLRRGARMKYLDDGAIRRLSVERVPPD